jgi:hypothetical protein
MNFLPGKNNHQKGSVHRRWGSQLTIIHRAGLFIWVNRWLPTCFSPEWMECVDESYPMMPIRLPYLSIFHYILTSVVYAPNNSVENTRCADVPRENTGSSWGFARTWFPVMTAKLWKDSSSILRTFSCARYQLMIQAVHSGDPDEGTAEASSLSSYVARVQAPRLHCQSHLSQRPAAFLLDRNGRACCSLQDFSKWRRFYRPQTAEIEQ